MKKMVKGELTVFLSLVFLLLISLVGAVIESASIQVEKNERRADASRAVESVFAEYHRGLLENYGVLALDETYETDSDSSQNILNRLSYYGAENIKTDIEKIRYLTDDKGKAFYEQAVKYEKERKGLTKADELLKEMTRWEDSKQENESLKDRFEEAKEQVEQSIEGGENPMEDLNEFLSDKILGIVLPDGFQVSDKKLNLKELPSKRELKKGQGDFKAISSVPTDTIFFNLYLSEKFGNAVDQKEKTALSYELEYLLNGKESDKKNLESTVKKLTGFRFALNYVYLMTDQEKQMEVDTAAGVMAGLILSPEAKPAIKTVLLCAWSYAEALTDIKTLLSGGKIGITKNEENWNLSLWGLIHIKDHAVAGKEDADGWSYCDFLRAELLKKKKETLSMKSLDLIEENFRQEQSGFRADRMLSGAGFHMSCPLRRGISYTFSTQYQYH